jgi:hypothetical protein
MPVLDLKKLDLDRAFDRFREAHPDMAGEQARAMWKEVGG